MVPRLAEVGVTYLSRMERVVRIVDRSQDDHGKDYWRDKTPEERLAALEFLRQQYMQATHADQRLQRVCRVVERTRR